MEKVAVGLSGGVDSAVAALILKENGYSVFAVTMDTGFLTDKDFSQVEKVAKFLNIPLYLLNLKKEFSQNIIDFFLQEYLAGRTPNPCVLCNQLVKFGFLKEFAIKKGAKYFATGHYVRKEYQQARYILKKAKDKSKDQSYFLYQLSQEQLSSFLAPLGEISKKEVIEKAKKSKVPARQAESQEICFIKEKNYAEFLVNNFSLKIEPGEIVDINGKVIGQHKGLIYYTIGQRKGLGISAKTPLYVIKIDASSNCLIVGEEKYLYAQEMLVENVNLVSISEIKQPLVVEVKIRSQHKGAKGIITCLARDRIKVNFFTPQRAITPGQSAVFYQDDVLLAGGTII